MKNSHQQIDCNHYKVRFASKFCWNIKYWLRSLLSEICIKILLVVIYCQQMQPPPLPAPHGTNVSFVSLCCFSLHRKNVCTIYINRSTEALIPKILLEYSDFCVCLIAKVLHISASPFSLLSMTTPEVKHWLKKNPQEYASRKEN